MPYPEKGKVDYGWTCYGVTGLTDAGGLIGGAHAVAGEHGILTSAVHLFSIFERRKVVIWGYIPTRFTSC